MAKDCQITISGTHFRAQRGELVLDAALKSGIDLPHDCRAGHCGTCCVRLISGSVTGGEGSVPGIVHACQCRIAGDAVFERDQPNVERTVHGVIGSVQYLASDIVEVGIKTERALPYLAGQYAKVSFDGHPSRSFSLTHPIDGGFEACSVWFHIRRMKGGRVTPLVGERIRTGHRVELTGPFGSAFFRPGLPGRLILVSTNTGFAPIWSIAVSALRDDPQRMMLIIVGGRTIDSLYMGRALLRLSRFPNVMIIPVCSTPQTSVPTVRPGRPTDYLPQMIPTDVVYVCGAPQMVDAVRALAVHAGASCYADPFLPTAEQPSPERARHSRNSWLGGRTRHEIGSDLRAPPQARRKQSHAISLHERG